MFPILWAAGGSWSFPYYARTEGMCGSPGTFVYWDTGKREGVPDMPFHCAALILTRVGDCLLAIPGHICPTTIRYPGIHVINTKGEVVDYFLHTARDRE